jgi:hypothetical protein
MRIRYLPVLCLLLAIDAGADDDPLADLKKHQPNDVQALIERLAYCSHWSGEEPYDAERGREIFQAMKDLRCDELEKDEAAARKRYAGQPRTIKALEQAKTWSE